MGSFLSFFFFFLFSPLLELLSQSHTGLLRTRSRRVMHWDALSHALLGWVSYSVAPVPNPVKWSLGSPLLSYTMYFSLESWDLLPQGRLCGRGLAASSPAPPWTSCSCPTHGASDPLVRVCAHLVYWHCCHTHQLPAEPGACPFPAPVSCDSWVCGCTCAGHTCRAHMHVTFGSCWELHMVLVAGAATLPPKFKWLWPSVIFRAELWACVSPDQCCFVFFVIYRFSSLGVALGPQHHLAEPAPRSHSLAVTTGEAWASLCPHSRFSTFYWLSVSICLYASFWLCLILWIDYFVLFGETMVCLFAICSWVCFLFKLWSFLFPLHFRFPSPHNSIPLN